MCARCPRISPHAIERAKERPSKHAKSPWAAESGHPLLLRGYALPIRPIRLFEHPEPIDAVAEVPDGPPLRFRWRRVMHEVISFEGPERIAPEWWKAQKALTRDYFRVEDKQGQRFWLFRAGLYERGENSADLSTQTERAVSPALPRWYMHGLFA